VVGESEVAAAGVAATGSLIEVEDVAADGYGDR